MGIYLNPDNEGFREAVDSEIYVDKSELLVYTNKVLGTEQKNICVSRPRRFGKSMAAKMLSAYYSKGCDSKKLFQKKKIAMHASYPEHLNKYNVIFLNIQNFLSNTHTVHNMIHSISLKVKTELLEEYVDFAGEKEEVLPELLSNIYGKKKEKFVFVIDEWDCIFREKKVTEEGYAEYLDFLRNLLKDRTYVALAYMTGILPIKKYGSHKVNSDEVRREDPLGGSALNMFTEFSMTNPRLLADYVGFTKEEVMDLCERYGMDFDEAARWYDGYTFKRNAHIYSPKSVVDAMLNKEYDSYWSQTETYEALKIYIEMNFDGLKDSVIEMLAGGRIRVNTGTFHNDMTTFHSRDDVLTLLIHLGYLAYDFENQEVFIPNYEISGEFKTAFQGAGWDAVVKAVDESEQLLRNTWNKRADLVAETLGQMHLTTSILTYNDENSLSCVVALAYYSARIYYTEIRELPTGEGYADIVYLPRKNHLDKPAMIIELKWDKSSKGAIEQIKERKYGKALEEYSGNLLLVGINYDRKTKVHECIIEEDRKLED